MEKTYIVKPIKERKKWARLLYRKETMVSSYGLKNCLLFASDFGIHFQFDRRTNEKKKTIISGNTSSDKYHKIVSIKILENLKC